jgi:hypothetical protein
VSELRLRGSADGWGRPARALRRVPVRAAPRVDHGAGVSSRVMGPGTAARDFFISHASEDKEAVARPLYEQLLGRGFSVWLDEVELTVGDSLRESIDSGLANCRFGIVIISKAFFAKRWPQYELDGLMVRHMSGTKTVLPVWHGVSQADVAEHSPSLAGAYAANTSIGIPKVADEIVRAFTVSGLRAPTIPGTSSRLPEDVISRWDQELSFPLSDSLREELLTARPPDWEWVLWGDALTRGLASHEAAWRDHQLRLVRPNGRGVDAVDIPAYLSHAHRMLEGALVNFGRLMDPDARQTIFGTSGTPGDPTMIEHHAQRFTAIYGQLLDWSAEVRSVRTDDELKRIIELMSALANRPILDLREFVISATAQLAKIPELHADADGSPVELRLQCDLTSDDQAVSAYKKELKHVRRHVARARRLK